MSVFKRLGVVSGKVLKQSAQVRLSAIRDNVIPIPNSKYFRVVSNVDRVSALKLLFNRIDFRSCVLFANNDQEVASLVKRLEICFDVVSIAKADDRAVFEKAIETFNGYHAKVSYHYYYFIFDSIFFRVQLYQLFFIIKGHYDCS